jgi:DNA-binding transcriptional MerR regulator
VDRASGYRYYSVSQLPRLNRIMALKDLGFTLPQIEHVLNANPTLDALRGMITLKKDRVNAFAWLNYAVLGIAYRY